MFPFSLTKLEARVAKLEAICREHFATVPTAVQEAGDATRAYAERVLPLPTEPDDDDPDADLVFACDKCGGLEASPLSGLCQRCEGRRASR